MDIWTVVIWLNFLHLPLYFVYGRGNLYPIQQNPYQGLPPCYTPYYGQDVATVDPYQTMNGIANGPQCVRICQQSAQCTATVYDRIHCCCFLYNRQLTNSDLVQRGSRDYYVLDRQCVGSGSSIAPNPQTSFTPRMYYVQCAQMKC